MTTTAKIAAKGCQSTGITEDLAETLHNHLGKKLVAVVELVSEARSEKRSGDEAVVLSILTIEPAPNSMTEDHLRELARSFHYERQLADGQLTIQTGDDIEPKVADVLKAGEKFRPHPFLPTDASLDNPICDVCGQVDDAGPHATDEDAADVDAELALEGDTDDDTEQVDDEPDLDPCPSPGCTLTAEHDGDHDPTDDRPTSGIGNPFATPTNDDDDAA